MFNEINKFLGMIKKEEVPLIIPNERCRECMSIAIIEMSRHNKNFINLLNHTLRVASMGVYLARKEGLNAKGKEICFLAAIFHDVFKEEENHEVKGKEFAEKILKSKKYHSDVIKKVGNAIAGHNSKNALNAIESKILWDADKLDKIGATAFLRRMKEKNLKNRIENDKNVFLYLDTSKEIFRKRIEHIEKCLI